MFIEALVIVLYLPYPHNIRRGFAK